VGAKKKAESNLCSKPKEIGTSAALKAIPLPLQAKSPREKNRFSRGMG